MQLPDLLRVLRNRWATIAIVMALAVVAAAVLLPSKLPQGDDRLAARATSTLVVDTGEDGAGNKQAAAKELNTVAVIASEGKVPAAVAAQLGTTVPGLITRVKITSSAATNTLSIVALDRTREGAARTADTYTETLLATLTDNARSSQAEVRASLTEQVRQLEAARAQLEEKVKADPTAKAELEAVGRQLNAQRAKLTERNAEPLASPGLLALGPATVRPLPANEAANRLLRLPVRVGLAALLGFLGALAAFVLLDRFDGRLRGKQAVEGAYGLPVLAEVPARATKRPRSLLLGSEPGDRACIEAHRILRTSILSSGPAAADLPGDDPARSCIVVVTSADPAEARTSTAANLAATFAEAGRDTLVVGLDLRHDDLATVLPPGPDEELVRLQGGRHRAEPVQVSVRSTGVPGLRLARLVQPLGPPAVVLPAVGAWLRALRSQVDAVVVDTPALLTCNDASEIIPFADTVLLTCRAGRTTAEAAHRAAEVLDRLQAPVCGVVLVGAEVRATARKGRADAGWPPRPAAGNGAPRTDEGGADGDRTTIRSVTSLPPVLDEDEERPEEAAGATAQPAARQDHPPADASPADGAAHASADAPADVVADVSAGVGADADAGSHDPPVAPPLPAKPAADLTWRPVAVPVTGGPAAVRRTLSRARQRLTGRRHLRR